MVNSKGREEIESGQMEGDDKRENGENVERDYSVKKWTEKVERENKKESNVRN